ncbi:MAG: phenylalanine 4-monooxygenase [Fimbriimonadaceae bacterium]|nr:phenylalanine 4-monooxygenase [Chitinophagales bacterium]
MNETVETNMVQDYSQYTPEHFKVWEILFERQMTLLKGRAADVFMNGIELIHFTADRIAKFDEFNIRLETLTGWNAVVVPGLIPNKDFFELLKNRKFPASTWLRSMEQLDYLEEPDMFHDVFAHLPLLTNKTYCAYLYGLSKIALSYIDDPVAVELISRIYWYTVEFGLIRDNGLLRIYGSGILSSQGESIYCLKSGIPSKRIDYNVEKVLDTPYIKDKFQTTYFVIEDCLELFESLPDIEQGIIKRIQHPELYIPPVE